MLSGRNPLPTLEDDHVDRHLGTTDDDGDGADTIAVAEAAADEAEALATAVHLRATGGQWLPDLAAPTS